MKRVVCIALLVTQYLLSWPVSTGVCLGVPPAEELLPATTKALLSLPDVQRFRVQWDKTQLGQLMADPIMQPFSEDLQRQVREKLLDGSFHVSLSWTELLDACAGELALAAIQPNDDPKAHASVLLADVTGKRAAAEAVVAKAAKSLAEQGAKRTEKTVHGHTMVIHELPRPRGQIEIDRVIRVLTADQLIVGTDEQTVADILDRITSGNRDDTLSSVPAYRLILERVTAADSRIPEAHWYIDPFDYAQVLRTARRGPRKRRKDMLAILRDQGFDAAQAMGGIVHVATGQQELLHRTLIYAPPVPGESQRYRLAARMLEFPNSSQWDWPTWIPRDLATAVQLRWKLRAAFEHSKTLVDAVAGDEGFFDDLLTSIKEDPNGPQIDVRNQFVRYLGERLTIISDNVDPITPESERLLVAVEVTDAEAVRQTVHKALVTDPDARAIEVEGHTIWEILAQQSEELPDLELELGLDDIDPLGEAPAAEKPAEDRILTNAAVTVAHGRLLIATHVDYLAKIIKKRPADDRLVDAEDFRRVMEQLERVGAGADSLRSFSRTDEAYRPTYELIRQGKMPNSQSLFGKLLNRILGPEDEDAVRTQAIDGSQLPDFQAVRRYLGPAGVFMRSADDGWMLSGVLLPKHVSIADSEPESASVTALDTESGELETR